MRWLYRSLSTTESQRRPPSGAASESSVCRRPLRCTWRIGALFWVGLVLHGQAADPTLSWSLGPVNYPSPGALVANCTVQVPSGVDLLSLLWRPHLPAGWTVMMAWGDGAPEFRSGSGELVFTGPTLGTNGTANFFYIVNVPAGESGTRLIQPTAEFQLSDEINPRELPAALLYLGASLTVAVGSTGSGQAFPSGAVSVNPGADQTIQFLPDPYYHVGAVSVDGMPVGNPTNYTFTVVLSNHTLDVAFAENLCPLGTPEWWLAQYGLTAGGFPAQELADTDGDGSFNWEEYVAGTIPTDASSVLRISHLGEAVGTNVTEHIVTSTNQFSEILLVTQRTYRVEGVAIAWSSEALRRYDLEWAADLHATYERVPGATNLPATPPLNVFTNGAWLGDPHVFYRVRVSRTTP